MDADATGAFDPPSQRFRTAVAVLGTALTVTSALLVAGWSTSPLDWLEGLARALVVGAPIAVGLYAYDREPFRRFGALLIGLGVIWFVVTLSNSPNDVLHSIGRVAAWPAECAIIYVVLAFPTGRLTSRADRVIVWVVAIDVLVLYLPSALLVESYPVPSVYSACTSGCPGNAFDVVGQQPAFLENVVYPLREVVIIGAAVAATVRLGARLRAASPVMRRTLEPVLVVAIFRVAALGATIFARRLDLDPDRLLIGGWMVALAPVRGARDAAAGDAAARPRRARAAPRGARQRVRRPVDRDHLPARRRGRSVGRRARRAVHTAAGGVGPVRDRGRR